MLEELQAKEFRQALGNNPYILLIEDEPIAQKVHTLMLQKLGCKVDLAPTGMQALAMCANHYDMILLDCGLPDIDGFELDKQLRALEQIFGFAGRPHIMLTAFAFETIEQEYQSAGINDYAVKPVAYTKLQALIQKWASA